MRNLVQLTVVAAMALSTSAAVAQGHASYAPFINICGRDVYLSNPQRLQRAVDYCFHGSVRIAASPTSVTISFDPANMPLIGVGPGRPPKFTAMPIQQQLH